MFRDSVDRVVEQLESMADDERDKVLMAGMQHDQLILSIRIIQLFHFPTRSPSPVNTGSGFR